MFLISNVCVVIFWHLNNLTFFSPPPQERGSAMGKLEPISPVSPAHLDPDLDLVPARFSKEELIQNMDRVDREITMVEQQICKLRKKQVRTPTGLVWRVSAFHRERRQKNFVQASERIGSIIQGGTVL